MKIVSWNCRGAFRDKYTKVAKYDADIYVISEAENPEKYADNREYGEYLNYISDYNWLGDEEDKGILIFSKNNIKVENNFWNSKHKFFLSVKIKNSLDLVGVWTQNNKTLKSKYVEEAIPYLRIYEDKIKESDKIIFCGDFNSNKIWDKEHKGRCHTDMVKLFEYMNLKSIYHEIHNEEQGKESIPTFFEYLHEDKPYHIDYVFSKPDLVKNLEIGTYEEFVGGEDNNSDHVPLIFEVGL